MNKDENRNTPYHKLEWIHFAIQEAMNGNIEELDRALPLVEDLREYSIQTRLKANAPLQLAEVNRLRELLSETEYRLEIAEDVLGRSDWNTIYREIIDEDGGEE